MQAYLEKTNPQPLITQKEPGVVPYRHTSIRFLALFLLIFVQFANEYSFNNPQALQDSIQKTFDINEAKFNALYTIIALPNIFFSIVAGIIVDYIGIRKSFVIFSIGLPLSQTIVALGGTYGNYNLMLAGRFFFGIICQSVIISQTCFVSSWFIGKQLSLAVGLAISLPELGNAANSYFTPIIYQKTQSLGPPLFTSVGLCVLAMISAFIVTYLDIKAEQIDKKNNIKVVNLENESLQQQQFKFQDLKNLKPIYWLVAFLTMFAIGQYVPFLDNSNILLQVRFCFSQVTAGKNIMITYIVVGMFVFPLAQLVDRIGHKRYFAILGMVIFTLGHFIILVYPQCSDDDLIVKWSGVSWGLFLLGIGYCFYATCLVSSVPLVVKPSIIGTAFGIVSMLQNLVQFLFPTLAALIVQSSSNEEAGYRHLSLFYFVIGLCGILLSILLLFISDKNKKKLDANSKQKIVKHVPFQQIETDNEKAIHKLKQQSTKKYYPIASQAQQINHSKQEKINKVERKTQKLQLQLFKYNIEQKLNSIKQKDKIQKKQKKLKSSSPTKMTKNPSQDDYQNFASQQDNYKQQHLQGQHKTQINGTKNRNQEFLL